ALPCLTAVLRAAGHEVIQKDLNVESYNHFLTQSQLEKAFAKIQANYNGLLFFGADPKEVKRLLAQKDLLLQEVEPAKRTLRNPRDFYDYPRFTAAQQVLADCLKVIALPYPGARLSFTAYQAYYSPDSTTEILKAVQDPALNLYDDFYKEQVIPQLRQESPGLVGISISSGCQILPGLSLAYLVKQHLENVHVVIGGLYFTILKDKLRQNPHLFSLFDSVILHEGETALLQLVSCLENKKPLATVPNLLYQDGVSIESTAFFEEDLDALPTPSWEGLPLDQYFSPQLVLMIYASRGCYWGRCVFCNHCLPAGKKYRMRSPGKIIEDIRELKARHGTNVFGFSDLAAAPGILAQLAEAICCAGGSSGVDARPLQINWFCMTRFENQLDQALCAKLARAGCKILLFGLESGSDRVLTIMDKGTCTATIRKVLTASNKAGIANFVTCFFGFPTETWSEARATVDFLATNARRLASLSIMTFELLENSIIQQNPLLYNIARLPMLKNQDLSWNYDYQTAKGLSPQEVKVVADLFHRICGATYPDYYHHYMWYLFYLLDAQKPTKNRGQRPALPSIFTPGQWQAGLKQVQQEFPALSSSGEKTFRRNQSPKVPGDENPTS
ncbi:MAG TPA: radical SAM protein, partial [Bacillota bacterium]|nr:radical SAM protein [Bacillota bacterium]